MEFALTDAQRAHGLMGRTELRADSGMLFVFPGKLTRSFYMKNCYVPIDVAFIDDDQTIVNYFTMAVEADPARPVRSYMSDKPVRYVLELPGGTLEALGVNSGDRVALPLKAVSEGAVH